ncbi:flagellar assembly peptidoglycan hydrolase FlgJ [Thorsellia kenyensis]|uniref:Peptidoglycan hydrolase FlgJ n=1 Tax=Thorsellia kenyensis TaxID=1549888 RepID=A0ABV6CE86_9GAMM
MNNQFDLLSASYDANGLNQLKTAVAKDPNGHIKEVAKQVEGVFLNMMLKSMRSAIPKDSLFNSDQTDLYYSLYDQQLAQELSKSGVGFANELIKNIELSQNPSSLTEVAEKYPAGLPLEKLNNLLINENQPILIQEHKQEGTIAFRSNYDTIRYAKEKMENYAANISEKTGAFAKGVFEGAKDFVNKLTGPAQLASKDTGIHPNLILAQAALESGWGKSEIKTHTGEPSHNLFGIKAGKSWQGKTTEILTTEFIDGSYQKVRAKFRVYNNYQHALSDYVDLITQNPRYKHVLTAPNAEKAAIEIQKAGYATDPNYANKLISILGQLKSESNKVAKQYNQIQTLRL